MTPENVTHKTYFVCAATVELQILKYAVTKKSTGVVQESAFAHYIDWPTSRSSYDMKMNEN